MRKIGKIFLVVVLQSIPVTCIASSKPKQKAIVIGGGPVGLATAITLADEPHCYDVQVFEATTPSSYDPTRAYLYNINPRGQRFTERHDYIQKNLESRGVGSAGVGLNITYVPADPKDPIDSRSVVFADKDKKPQKSSIWIPRHTMTEILTNSIGDWNSKKNNNKGSIQHFTGMECLSLDATDHSKIAVKIKDVLKNVESTHEAKLVIGADGYNSKVRECLALDKSTFSNWKNMKRRKFKVKKYISPATGLRIKAIQFPPEFQIPVHEGEPITTKSTNTYVLRSINKKPKNFVSLGFLPMRDNHAIRPANVITRPDHEVWTIKEGPKIQKWFQDAFPRIPFNNLISPEEWDRFAKAEGTRFPNCQYCPGLQAGSDDGECGIALVGDAIHAFPPDIGQGINSGLEDVLALDKALKGGDKKENDETKSLGHKLASYEKERSPEIKALIRLARFGNPYQYKQSHRIDRIRASLLTINLLMRLLLNKISFGVIPKSCIMLAQNPDLKFSQVMRRADRTTFGLYLVLLAGIFKIFRFGLK